MRSHEPELREALRKTNGSLTETAKMLEVSRATVYRWMRRYGIVIAKTPVKVLDVE